MPTTASKVIAEATKHLGYVEGKGQSTIFGKWFGANGVAWCAMFVSYTLAKAGAPEILKGAQTAKGAARVSLIKNHLKKHGAKQIKPADAKAGDVIIFDWPGGYETDHVGFIRAKSNPTKKVVYTIEGNTSSGVKGSQANGGGVYKRTRSFGVVESIWRPKYVTEAVATVTPVTAAVTEVTPPIIGEVPPTPLVTVTPTPKQNLAPTTFTNLKKGSKGATVKKIQTLLKVTADGDYGPITEGAVKAYQNKKGLPVTGVVDQATYERLTK